MRMIESLGMIRVMYLKHFGDEGVEGKRAAAKTMNGKTCGRGEPLPTFTKLIVPFKTFSSLQCFIPHILRNKRGMINPCVVELMIHHSELVEVVM